MPLRLLEHPLSSYAQKVKIVLREKNLGFTAETPESFGAGSPEGELASANPRGEVTLFESTVIREYLDDCWSETPLLPRDRAPRAQARLTEDVCDTQYEAINLGWGESLGFKRAEGGAASTATTASTG